MLLVYKLESVFNLATLSFLSNCQDLAESDKVLVRFALTLKTTILADGLWAIKITNSIVGAEKFREVSSKDRSLAYSKIFLSDANSSRTTIHGRHPKMHKICIWPNEQVFVSVRQRASGPEYPIVFELQKLQIGLYGFIILRK